MPAARFDPSELYEIMEHALRSRAGMLLAAGPKGRPRKTARGGRNWFPLADDLHCVAFQFSRRSWMGPMRSWVKRTGDLLAGAAETVGHASFDYRALGPWLSALEIFAGELDASVEDKWRKALAAQCDYMARQVEARVGRSATTAHELATSPNHFIRWVAIVRKAGTVLGRKDWVKLADGEADRFAADMHPDGYWPEHHGPALRYNFVSLRGMAMWRRASGSRRHDKTIRKAVEFSLKTCLPGGICSATLDGRNRHGRGSPLSGLCDVLSLSPVGRRLIDLSVAGLRRRAAEAAPRALGGEVSGAIGTVGCITGGATSPLPWEKKDARCSLSDLPAAVRRSGPWTISTSAIPSPYWQHNAFFLERQELVSVHHDDAGLIVGGGNDRNHPEAATFALFEGGEIWYNVPVAGRVARSGKGERLECDLGPCSGSIVATPRSGRRLELVLTMTPRTLDDQCFINLQIPAGREPLSFAGKKVTGTRRRELKAGPKGSVMRRGRWSIKLPAGAALVYPHQPWNPYGWPEYETGPRQAVGLVRAALGSAGGTLKVVIEVD